MTKIKPNYGKTNPSPDEFAAMPLKRYGSVVELIPEKDQYYRELHASGWQGVMDQIKRSNIQNYSIFTHEIAGIKYLFSYFEYVGEDFEADMALMAEDEETRRWWAATDPCQKPLPSAGEGNIWSTMETVFLLE